MSRWNRHDYAIISRRGRLYAYQRIEDTVPENLQEHLENLFLSRCGVISVPAILCRQENPEPGMVKVGWSSWLREDGRRLRFASAVPEACVEHLITPYEVFAMETDWPEELRGALEELRRLGNACGISFGIIGAAGMQILTGRSYLHEASDLDLIVPYHADLDLRVLYARCGDVSERYSRPLDIELVFPGFGGVKLAEWVSAQKTVLVKGNTFVDIIQRQECVRMSEECRQEQRLHA